MSSRGGLFELFVILVPRVVPFKTAQQKNDFLRHPARMGSRESLGRGCGVQKSTGEVRYFGTGVGSPPADGGITNKSTPPVKLSFEHN